MDDGRILRLRAEARSALRLRIGGGHRSNNKDRGSQSHGDFTHQILLLSVAVWGKTKDGRKPWLRCLHDSGFEQLRCSSSQTPLFAY